MLKSITKGVNKGVNGAEKLEVSNPRRVEYLWASLSLRDEAKTLAKFYHTELANYSYS